MIFSEVYFQDVHGEEDFHFQVEDHGDFYWIDHYLLSKWRLSSLLFTCFLKWCSYHLTPQQRTLWKAIQDLPMDQDRKNACILIQRTKQSFPYSLQESSKNQDK